VPVIRFGPTRTLCIHFRHGNDVKMTQCGRVMILVGFVTFVVILLKTDISVNISKGCSFIFFPMCTPKSFK